MAQEARRLAPREPQCGDCASSRGSSVGDPWRGVHLSRPGTEAGNPWSRFKYPTVNEHILWARIHQRRDCLI